MEKILNRAADNIRILSASMVEKAKSGHPGGAMGGADYINVLYSQFLNFDPDDMTWACLLYTSNLKMYRIYFHPLYLYPPRSDS